MLVPNYLATRHNPCTRAANMPNRTSIKPNAPIARTILPTTSSRPKIIQNFQTGVSDKILFCLEYKNYWQEEYKLEEAESFKVSLAIRRTSRHILSSVAPKMRISSVTNQRESHYDWLETTNRREEDWKPNVTFLKLVIIIITIILYIYLNKLFLRW